MFYKLVNQLPFMTKVGWMFTTNTISKEQMFIGLAVCSSNIILSIAWFYLKAGYVSLRIFVWIGVKKEWPDWV